MSINIPISKEDQEFAKLTALAAEKIGVKECSIQTLCLSQNKNMYQILPEMVPPMSAVEKINLRAFRLQKIIVFQ